MNITNAQKLQKITEVFHRLDDNTDRRGYSIKGEYQLDNFDIDSFLDALEDIKDSINGNTEYLHAFEVKAETPSSKSGTFFYVDLDIDSSSEFTHDFIISDKNSVYEWTVEEAENYIQEEGLYKQLCEEYQLAKLIEKELDYIDSQIPTIIEKRYAVGVRIGNFSNGEVVFKPTVRRPRWNTFTSKYNPNV